MSWDINSIIDNKNIEIFAFVIISPYTSKTTGIEGVCKGINYITGEFISYGELYSEAKKVNRLVELEKICLEKTLYRFGKINRQYDNLLLFVNVGETTFDLLINDKEYLLKLLKKNRLSHNKIVLELGDFKYESLEKVVNITNIYRDEGFIIAVDNIGENYFTLDKIVAVRPDIIKLHIKAFDKIKNKNYREYIKNNIMDFCESINVVIVVIGVESIEEFYSSLDSGARFVEGFYINKPMIFNYNNIVKIMENINHDEKIKQYSINLQKDPTNRSISTTAIYIFNELKALVEGMKNNERKEIISRILANKTFVGSIYFLDKYGIQSSDIYIKERLNKQTTSLFKEYALGSDHSQGNEYINLIQFDLGVWVTRPHIYPFSNEYCFTVSSFILNENKEKEILCIVFNERLLKEYIVMSKSE
jgi:EAL domain-containing protein (putative c-di-GMP-specific phosphodiesterase class I)